MITESLLLRQRRSAEYDSRPGAYTNPGWAAMAMAVSCGTDGEISGEIVPVVPGHGTALPNSIGLAGWSTSGRPAGRPQLSKTRYLELRS